MSQNATIIEHPISGRKIVVQLNDEAILRLAKKQGSNCHKPAVEESNFVGLNTRSKPDKPDTRSTL